MVEVIEKREEMSTKLIRKYKRENIDEKKETNSQRIK